MSAGPTPAGLATPPARRGWLMWVAAILAAAVFGTAIGVLAVTVRHSSASPTVVSAGPTPPPETWAPSTRRAPAFRLADENGSPLTLAQFRGRPVIVTFIDPLCRNYCPLEAKELGALERGLPAASRPAIVAVSVNVDGNARANLVDDRSKWRVGSAWHWAVGGARPLASVWKRYGIGVTVITKKIAGVTVRDVAHTEAAYIVDAQGYERALFLWPFTTADVQAALKRIE